MENILDKRKKKPKFVRQDLNKKKSLGKKWRKPKGLHSKLRLKRAGHGKKVSVGYGSPRKIRNLVVGLKPKLINNIQDLSEIKKVGEGIIISSKIGDKKRIEILKKAQSQNIQILNIKNIEDKIKKITEKITKKKEEKKTKEKTRQEAKKEAEKKAKEEKEKPKEKTEEEKKKELTKKLTETTEKKKPDIQAKETHKVPKQMKISAPKQK